MLKDSCPGSEQIRSPYPEDIICPYCNFKNEIWSDEPDMTCKSCKSVITRDMPPTCLEWCPAAKECIGVEKYERLIKALSR